MIPKDDDLFGSMNINAAITVDDDDNLLGTKTGSIDNTNGFNTIKINRPNKNYQQPIITDDFNLFQTSPDTNNHHNTTAENSTCDSNIEMTSSIDSLSNDININQNGFFSNCGHANDIINESSNGVNFEQKSATDSSFSTSIDQLITTPSYPTENHEEETFESLNACLTETTNTIANLSLAINFANDSFETNNINNDVYHLNSIKEINTNSNTNEATGEFLSASPSFSMLNSKDKDASPNKPAMFMKDMNIEDRLRIIRDKQEQELAKRKKELEENLKRKEELWYRQQKEKQKKIDEYKTKENEKRLACEERRRKREEKERNRLNELIKREQERAKLTVKSNMKGSEWTLAVNGNTEQVSSDDQNLVNIMNKSHSAFNLTHKKKDSMTPEAAKSDTGSLSKRLTNSTMRLSSSAMNGSKHLATENQDNNEVAMKSRRSRTVPTTPMHCTNKPKNAQITPAINEPPETNNTHSNFRNNISKMMCASHTTAPNNSSSLNKSLYWEGPPAHFMLPTHAIHCRLSRSVERCPRACKAAAEAAAAEEAAQQNSQKPLQTIVERNKPLSAHLQETINRLSMPKKPAVQSEPQDTMNILSSTHHAVNSHRSGTPQLSDSNINNDNLSTNIAATTSSNSLTLNKKSKQPTSAKMLIKPKIPNSKSSNGMSHTSNHVQQQDHTTTTNTAVKQPKNLTKVENLKQAARKKSIGQSTSNGSIVSLNNGLNPIKKSNSNSTLSLNQQSKQLTPKPSSTSKFQLEPSSASSHISSPSRISTLTSNSAVSCSDSKRSDIEQPTVTNEIDNMKSDINQVINDMIDVQLAINDEHINESLRESEVVDNEPSSNDVETSSTDKESCAKLEEEDDETKSTVTPSSSDSLLDGSLVKTVEVESVVLAAPQRVLTEEEEYKIKLEEKRREAREKAAREAEIERQRQEVIRLEEEEKRRLEEEQERLAEEELNRLHRLAKEQEEARLQAAMELNERLENERREKEENERRVKEENERKAKEDSERVERERLEKIRKEEEERLERRKKIDLIMRRVHKDENSSGSTTNSTSNLLISTSNNDLSQLKSMTSSFVQAKDSNDNISSTLSASMTTSLINTPITDSDSVGRFKTPLLQSILSKTRITTILNKYADDPLVNNPTLSLIAQSNRVESIEMSRGEGNIIASDLGHESDESSQEKSEKSDDQEDNKKDDEDDEDKEHEYELQMTEVNVVVEDSSADSSSPSSPASSDSSRSSQQASPPAATSPQPPTTPLQTQLSA